MIPQPVTTPRSLLLLLAAGVGLSGAALLAPAAVTAPTIPDVAGDSSYVGFVRLLQDGVAQDKITIKDSGGATLDLDKSRRDIVKNMSTVPGGDVTLSVETTIKLVLTDHSGKPASEVAADLKTSEGLFPLCYESDGSGGWTWRSCDTSDLVQGFLIFSDGPGEPPQEVLLPFVNVPVGSLIGLKVAAGSSPAVPPTSVTMPPGALGLNLMDLYVHLRELGVPHEEMALHLTAEDAAIEASTGKSKRRAVGHDMDGDPVGLFHDANKAQILERLERVVLAYPEPGDTVTWDSGNDVPDVILTSMVQINVPVSSYLGQTASVVYGSLQTLGLNPVYYHRNLVPCTSGCETESVIAIGHFPSGPLNPPTTEPPHTLPPLSAGDMIAIVVPTTDNG